MRTSILMPLAAAAMLVACKGGDATPAPPAGPPLETVLPNIPFPPNAEPVASERADKALKLVFASGSPADSVVAYYRTLLAAPPYRLINEGMSGNITSFYVEQDGPSMWVTVQPVDMNNSLVTIAGAQGDPNRQPDPAIPDPVGAQGQPLPRPTSVPLPDDPRVKPQD